MSTDRIPLDAAGQPRRRMQFDPTINLGHVLTFVGFIATGFTAYSALDKRLALQEARGDVEAQIFREQDARTRELLRDLRSEVKETRGAVEELGRSAVRLGQQK